MTSSPDTAPSKWQFWIDRGGTFTDIVAQAPDGTQHALKLLSENPTSYDDAAVEGMHRLIGSPSSVRLPASAIASVKMGTTVATNALLERKGAPVVLVMTQGLTDQLEIGTQARDDIFARKIRKPTQLYQRVIAANERVRADGTVERPLDLDQLRHDLGTALKAGMSSVAFVFMHAYAYPNHEQQAVQLANEMGFQNVSASHDVSSLIKIVGRGDTTVADAYLSPVLKSYVKRVASAFDTTQGQPTPRIDFMTSSGGLTPASNFRGRDAILSGPAGGVVAMAKTAGLLGFDKVIGFDMGGTSTDVAHYSGHFERSFENTVAGVRIHAPMLAVETVAAGGGSIITTDGARLIVGPESAGANPGPACYRRGGPLTVTDANVMVGKLNPQWFPNVFGENGDEPLDTSAVNTAFARLAKQTSGHKSPHDLADGAIRIAVENMANAIKKISIGRGHDVSRYALQCFGAAGGQHACLVADTLGIETILIHPLSGLLSAYGMGLADLRAGRAVTIEEDLSEETLARLNTRAQKLTDTVSDDLQAAGVAGQDTTCVIRAHLKYAGSDSALPITLSDDTTMRQAFEAAHLKRYGFASPEKQVTIATLDVEATGGGARLEHADTLPRLKADPVHATSSCETSFYSQGAHHRANVFQRHQLSAGSCIDGPALVIEDHQTVVLEPGWTATTSENGVLVLNKTAFAQRQAITSQSADPVMLEVFNNHFMAIAEQMGAALANTAQSVNIKERLDFSCAVFDRNGDLVANAPHVPVHLGSMDRSVATIIKKRSGTMRPGDVYMLNAPYEGGTHLPDITVITPVFDADSTAIDFYVASRGHHADIGGITPGSMSPKATSISEEGVLIDNVTLVRDGIFLEDDVLRLLADAPYPARNPSQNVADLKAQVAANARGARDLGAMVAVYGRDVVQNYMRHVQDNAEEAVRRLLTNLNNGKFRVEMDDRSSVQVTITIDAKNRSAKIDFTGTSPQQTNNFNAPEPVTRAAVLYVIRVLLDNEIPMNAGCLRPLEIIIPESSLLSPKPPAAVVAGNVETSQVVTNALFAAFGALGSSQGTMNNLTFGDGDVQYYETICSGSPAGPGFDGTSAVQVHMTNTRLTDPEILELRYPVIVDEFSIRRGSGGKGQWWAGDGTRRTLRFLKPMTAAILSGFRKIAPFGLAGGSAGDVGKNSLLRANNVRENLAGCAEVRLNTGDSITIDTPTGGGFGPNKHRDMV